MVFRESSLSHPFCWTKIQVLKCQKAKQQDHAVQWIWDFSQMGKNLFLSLFIYLSAFHYVFNLILCAHQAICSKRVCSFIVVRSIVRCKAIMEALNTNYQMYANVQIVHGTKQIQTLTTHTKTCYMRAKPLQIYWEFA